MNALRALKNPCLAVALILLGFGCTKHEEAETTYNDVVIDEIPKEIHIPTKLWDFIEGKANPDMAAAHGDDPHGDAEAGHGATADAGHGAPAEGGHGAPAGGDSVDAGGGGALFVPVDVILTSKSPGVLAQSPLRIRLPRGGGNIDLSQYTTEKPGSFFVSFEWPDMDPLAIESWFVSKARKRKLGDELWGAGCQSFFRITKGLQKVLAGEGLKVNTTRLRHLTVLGGHFIFSSRKSGQTSVAQVTFTDSRYPAYFCEGF